MHLVKARRTFVDNRDGREWRSTSEEMPEFFIRDNWESTMESNALAILNTSALATTSATGIYAEFDIKLTKVEES